ncbi:MAG: DUF6261 family protein [Tannerellaceae bacterium]|jgi:hypothetical protein|nr:DUF6261 family protein [Tannerellaceae bacterium]
MEIIRFSIGTLRNEGWFRFHTEFFALATLCGVDILTIDFLFSTYETLYKEADGLLELLRKSFVTTDTVAADRLRDSQYRGLRDAVKANLHSLDADTQAAAVKVSAVIGKYNSIITKGARADKTAAIDNLLQDLTQAEGGIDLSAEVTQLGVATWVNNLNSANTTYKQSLSERLEESTARPDTGRLQQVRAEMDHYYINMINVVDARLLAIGNTSAEEEGETEEPGGPVEGRDALPTTPNEKIIHFAKSLNTCITYYKSLLKSRRTRSNKKETEETEDGGEEI